jgi:putative membrane protein
VNGAEQARYADGEWHRLYPLTPLLKGGLALLAILGIIVVNLRDLILETIFSDDRGRADIDADPMVWLYENGFVGIAIAVILGVLLALVAGFYFSWRMNTFRITNEVVEVRNGILFRTHRKGRLDRIQGINIVRPFLARLVGAAKLEVSVAGLGGNVNLDYLSSAAADALRLEVLRLASGARAAETVPEASSGTSPEVASGAAFESGLVGEIAPEASSRFAQIVDQRVGELFAPERDPSLAPMESVVTMKLGRLIGSTVLSGFTLFALVVIGLIIWAVSRSGSGLLLIIVFPTLIGLGGFYVSRFMRSLRYSVASTPDGIRIGFGLLTTSNETLPPGRIHSIQVRQPLLWRKAGWWEVRVNRASSSVSLGAAGQANTTILPVGNLDDALKVLGLVAPELVEVTEDPETDSLALLRAGLLGSGTAEGFTTSPRRARFVRWFSWRRNGFALTPEFILLRTGVIWRQLVIVPEARMQSVEFHQGPIDRALRLGEVKVHTVSGPVAAQLGALDAQVARRLMVDVADAAIVSSSADITHRWRSSEVSA